MIISNQEEALKLFHSLDDHNYIEYPKGFDRKAAEEKFQLFVKRLQKQTKMSLSIETGSYIQDASYHSLIRFDYNNQLRFSNFGEMVTIFEEVPIDKKLYSIIQNLITEFRYTYIPEDYIYSNYDAKSLGVSDFKDWSDRFFDWV